MKINKFLSRSLLTSLALLLTLGIIQAVSPGWAWSEYVEGINDTLTADNLTYNDPFKELAIEYYPSRSYALKGIELWTGLYPDFPHGEEGTLTVRFYDTFYNPTNYGLPGNLLNEAAITITDEIGWYRVEIEEGISLTKGERYWISFEGDDEIQTPTAGYKVPDAMWPVEYWRDSGHSDWPYGPFQGQAYMFKFYKSPGDVSGCIDIKGFPVANNTVVIRQKNKTYKTETDDKGCYEFDGVNSEKPFNVTIKGLIAP